MPSPARAMNNRTIIAPSAKLQISVFISIVRLTHQYWLFGEYAVEGSPPADGSAPLDRGRLPCKEGGRGLWGSMSYPLEPKRWAQLLKLSSYPGSVTPELAVLTQNLMQGEEVVCSVFFGISLVQRLLIMSWPDRLDRYAIVIWCSMQAQANELTSSGTGHRLPNLKGCSTRIRTGVTRFRVWGANHYTIPQLVPRVGQVMQICVKPYYILLLLPDLVRWQSVCAMVASVR